MKTKLILLMLLSLFAIQGWANPLDSLETHSPGNNIPADLSGLNLSDGFNKPNRLDGVSVVNRTKGPVVAEGIPWWLEALLGQIPRIHISEVDINENFKDVPIGTSVTKTYEIWGFNLYEYDNIRLELRHRIGETTPLIYSNVFSVDKTTFRGSDIDMAEGGNRETIRVTYKPTDVGSDITKLDFIATVIDPDTHYVGLEVDCCEWPNSKFYISGNAVDAGHLAASALQSFRTLTVGESDTILIHVEGTNLNGPVTVTLDDHYSNNDMFSIEKFSLDPDATGAINEDVKLIYTPTAVGTHGVSVDVSGGGALEVASVVLTGHCEPPAHIITVDKSVLNFGTVVKGETSSPKSFTVTGSNLTNDIILSLSPECSHYTISPTRITPDDAAKGKLVTVTYHPSIAGTHNVSLTINEEGQLNGGQIVSLNGKCVANPTITVNTTSLDFETIEVGQEKPMSINVTGTNLIGSITVIKEETHGGQFTISRQTLPANGGNIIVTFKPAEAGSFGGCVRISSEGASPVSVSLTGKAQELSVYPTSLNFGTTYKNGTVTKKFTVYGGNLTGNVTLSSSNAKFTVTPTTITPAEAKTGKEVTVTFKPTAAGSYSGEITLSASGVTPKKVAVSGKCAVISSNPTSWDFGNVAVGKPVTKEIIVTGTNLTDAMSITLAETEGGQYSINKTTLPASGGTVIVTFKPTDAMTFGASLKISGGSAAAVSVSLTGKGVTPTITRNKSTLTFTGSSITSDYVKVTGTNLDDIISLTVTGSTNFTVSPSTISISDAADGKQVKVTCNPKNASSAEATLKISSPYASTKYVTLKYSRGSSGGGETQICSVEPEGGNEGGNNEFMNGESLDAMGTFTTDVNELAMKSKIYSEGLNIIIETPIEQKALISDIAGHVREVNLQTGRNEIPVNASSIYIVRIREKTTKLMLK